MVEQKLLDGVRLLPGEHLSGGVVGVVDDEHFGLFRHKLFQLLQRDFVVGRQRETHRDRGGGGGLDDGGVGHPAGLQVHDLIPGVHQAPDGQIDGKLSAGGHHDPLGGVGAAVLLRQFSGDALP